MDLLAYQAMPSLRDVSHDGMVVYIYYITAAGIPTARSWAAPVRATGMVRKRQAVWPVHHVENHTCRCRVILLKPARRAAVLGQPSSLRSHWYQQQLVGTKEIPGKKPVKQQTASSTVYLTMSFSTTPQVQLLHVH